MPSGIYYLEFEAQTIATASGDYDLFTITPADDAPVVLHWLSVTNASGTSDAGDASEENLRLRVIRGYTSPGTGGTDVTESGVGRSDPLMPNMSATVRTCDTAIGTTGTVQVLHSAGFNQRIGYEWVWPEQSRPVCYQTNTSIVVRLMAATADDIIMSGTLCFSEGI